MEGQPEQKALSNVYGDDGSRVWWRKSKIRIGEPDRNLVFNQEWKVESESW